MKKVKIIAALLVICVLASSCGILGSKPAATTKATTSSTTRPATSLPPATSSTPDTTSTFTTTTPTSPATTTDNDTGTGTGTGTDTATGTTTDTGTGTGTTSTTTSAVTSASSVAAMSTDFSQIGALDAKRLDWGPGGPKDKNNRSEGAIIYQERYGKYGAQFIAPESEKIYLTFDEGYENGFTPSILDTLKEKGVSAVFFVTYDFAKDNPELIKRIIDEGHILGNHSYKHKNMPEISLADAVEEIVLLHNYILDNYGYTMTLYRFPSGAFNEQTLLLVDQLGYTSVFWSWAYKDWEPDNQYPDEECLQRMLDGAHPGAIYLLHAVGSGNASVLPRFIDQMKSKGYVFSEYDVDYRKPTAPTPAETTMPAATTPARTTAPATSAPQTTAPATTAATTAATTGEGGFWNFWNSLFD